MITSRPGEPELSVVITSFNAVATIADCLGSLRAQETGRQFEVVLVDSSTDGTADLVRARHPEVRLIESRRRLHCGEARNRALEVVRAGVIAFLDADCLVDPDWVDAVLETHRSAELLVGGAVDNACPSNLVGWAYYFCEYNLWLPSRRRRRIPEMAGCCLSIKRAAYDLYGPFVEGTYSSDTAFGNITALVPPALRKNSMRSSNGRDSYVAKFSSSSSRIPSITRWYKNVSTGSSFMSLRSSLQYPYCPTE